MRLAGKWPLVAFDRRVRGGIGGATNASHATSIALDGAYLPMYLFGLVATGLGEALVMYVLGLPLFSALKRFNVAKRVGANSM